MTCSNYTTKRKSPNNPINQVARADLGSTLAEADRSGYTAKNIPNSRRKTGNLGVKSKRRKIENGNSLELNLTWKETQRLMRHPDTIVPSVFVVEGCEFEEFEVHNLYKFHWSVHVTMSTCLFCLHTLYCPGTGIRIFYVCDQMHFK